MIAVYCTIRWVDSVGEKYVVLWSGIWCPIPIPSHSEILSNPRTELIRPIFWSESRRQCDTSTLPMQVRVDILTKDARRSRRDNQLARMKDAMISSSFLFPGY